MATKSVELARECKRQFENCLYTSSTLLIWLRWLRGLKVFFTIAPIVCGSLGSWRILTASSSGTMTALGAIGSFLGGLLSTIYSALKLDTHIAEARTAAGELTSLRDSFRQAALVSSKKSFEEFEAEVTKLRARLDKVRALGLTPPDLCFKMAQKKVRSGDYTFDLDQEVGDGALLPEASKSEPRSLLE
ncbi:MAG TPA: hypothetical protein VH062_01470 [Polyangiaceae bacterium]|jgi:hypothetical protein|nr:hypothetical protein [Polyangiaceae bacterium]